MAYTLYLYFILYTLARRSMAVPFQQSGRALRALEELEAVILDGYASRALQRSPHLVLLNTEWCVANAVLKYKVKSIRYKVGGVVRG